MIRKGWIFAALIVPAAFTLSGCQKPDEQAAQVTMQKPDAAPRHKILITAQVKDSAAWEQAFRTHGELFKSSGSYSPIVYGIGEDNHVAVLEEVPDIDAFNKTMNSPENVATMDGDGVIQDTVKVIVLDKELSF